MYIYSYLLLVLPSENSIAVSSSSSSNNNNNNNNNKRTCAKISRNKSRRQGNHIVEPTNTNLQNYPQQQTRRNP